MLWKQNKQDSQRPKGRKQRGVQGTIPGAGAGLSKTCGDGDGRGHEEGRG